MAAPVTVRVIVQFKQAVASNDHTLVKALQTQAQAPGLGIAGFLSIAVMRSLLVFVGEAVRDAFDPRKAFGGGGK